MTQHAMMRGRWIVWLTTCGSPFAEVYDATIWASRLVGGKDLVATKCTLTTFGVARTPDTLSRNTLFGKTCMNGGAEKDKDTFVAARVPV